MSWEKIHLTWKSWNCSMFIIPHVTSQILISQFSFALRNGNPHWCIQSMNHKLLAPVFWTAYFGVVWYYLLEPKVVDCPEKCPEIRTFWCGKKIKSARGSSKRTWIEEGCWRWFEEEEYEDKTGKCFGSKYMKKTDQDHCGGQWRQHGLICLIISYFSPSGDSTDSVG